MIKVAKFGGSSLADSNAINKVVKIIENDQQIRYVIVSAAGVRFPGDIKITDYLINLAEEAKLNKNIEDIVQTIFSRYENLLIDLALSDMLDLLKADLNKRLLAVNKDNFADIIKSFGEDWSALILCRYLNNNNIACQCLTPTDLKLLVQSKPVVKVLEKAYENVANKLLSQTILTIIPGFYGVDENDNVVTFARGGSDLTGAIIAASVKADVYENYTDVDNVFVVSPKIIANPPSIKYMTYKEMRELSYAGFNVLHEETIIPLYKHHIPINIKNTNNPAALGTFIGDKGLENQLSITGIAGKKGFTSIYIEKYLMNREVGFVKKLLAIFEENQVPFEHMPSGIDYISVILEAKIFYQHNYQNIIARIKSELAVDLVKVIDGLAIVVIVGENIVERNVLNRSIAVLKNSGIKILSLSMAELGNSLIIGVDEQVVNTSIKVLFEELFK